MVITVMGETLLMNDESIGRCNIILKTKREYVSSPYEWATTAVSKSPTTQPATFTASSMVEVGSSWNVRWEMVRFFRVKRGLEH